MKNEKEKNKIPPKSNHHFFQFLIPLVVLAVIVSVPEIPFEWLGEGSR
jgi:hypothetical protein